MWVDWEALPAAVYEVQWFLDADLTRRAGSTTVTVSKMEIGDLEPGTQSGDFRSRLTWFRVHAVRGSKTGPWSEPQPSPVQHHFNDITFNHVVNDITFNHVVALALPHEQVCELFQELNLKCGRERRSILGNKTIQSTGSLLLPRAVTDG